jgi:multiple sugar transport system permease protein
MTVHDGRGGGSERAGPRTLPRLRFDARSLLVYGTLLLFTIMLFTPLIWIVSLSLKTPAQVGQFPPSLIPDPVTLGNYPQALVRQQPFFLYLRNTLLVAGLAIIGELLTASLVAYGFAKFRFPGKNVLFLVLLGTMMVPLIVKLVPLFIIFRELNWINTLLPLIVPSYFASSEWTPLFIFLMRQFFMAIPDELRQAARVDGASELRIWWSIYLPLSKPVMAVVVIFSFQFIWNDFLGPLVFLQQQEVKTVTLGLYSLLGMFAEYQVVMAGAVAVIVPMVIMFILFQRYLLSGISITGGLKG